MAEVVGLPETLALSSVVEAPPRPRRLRELRHRMIANLLPAPPLVDRPIRVCFMIDRLSAAGTESQLVALIDNLDRSHVEPYLCILDGDNEGSRALEPKKCPILRLGVHSFRSPWTPYWTWRLTRFLSHNEIDVFQVYFPRSTYLGVPAARLAGVPFVVRTRNNLGYWMTPGHRWLGRLYNRLVDRTLANCEACRQSVLADEGPAPETVIVLENGVDVSRFIEMPDLDPAEPVRRIGIVANLRPVKGLDVFVDAAAAVAADHPDAIFQIAGEGELRPALAEQAQRLGIGDKVQLVGSTADVPAFLAGVQMAVLCSLSEGMSNAVLEYMAAGRAIVATTVGANAHLIENGVHGLLIPPGDRSRLADALDRLLRNPGLAAKLGAAARQRAIDRYSRQAMVQRFQAFYQGLVRRRDNVLH